MQKFTSGLLAQSFDRRSFVVGAIQGGVGLLLAARMGYNGAYVAGLVTLSTLLGLASLPFALGVLRPWIGA